MFNKKEWAKAYRQRRKEEGKSYYQDHKERILAKRKQDYQAYAETYKVPDLEGEEWLPLVGNEEHYQGSNQGRIKSTWHMKERIIGGCLDEDGYIKITLTNPDRSQSTYRRARLIALTWIPNPENKPEIDHINTDRTDDRVENLKWVTSKENKQNPQSKINRSKVDYGFNRGRKRLYKNGPYIKEINYDGE